MLTFLPLSVSLPLLLYDLYASSSFWRQSTHELRTVEFSPGQEAAGAPSSETRRREHGRPCARRTLRACVRMCVHACALAYARRTHARHAANTPTRTHTHTHTHARTQTTSPHRSTARNAVAGSWPTRGRAEPRRRRQPAVSEPPRRQDSADAADEGTGEQVAAGREAVAAHASGRPRAHR